jgi:GNAT superfamily N-acetyltransferase
LTTFQNAIATLHLNVVEPAWRNTWVGVGLKAEIFRELRERGTSRVRCATNIEMNPDTAKMASRTKAKILSRTGRYVFDL